jgi:hypothetical protein
MAGNPSARTAGAPVVVETDLRATIGFTVVDCDGRRVGTVECPMHSGRPEDSDAIAVKAGLLGRRRRLVPAEMIGSWIL